MTGAIGMASEGGEFAEIVKKCNLVKPLTMKLFLCKRELGDIMCIGLAVASSSWT